jgi:hypothetical protein
MCASHNVYFLRKIKVKFRKFIFAYFDGLLFWNSVKFKLLNYSVSWSWEIDEFIFYFKQLFTKWEKLANVRS